MNVKEIRRLNLIALVSKYESQEDFSEAVGQGIAAGWVSQVINRTRNMGDATAKKIQDGLNLGDGWMDRPHDEAEIEAAANISLVAQRKKIQNTKHLTALFRQMDQWAKARKLGELSPDQRAILFQRAMEAQEPEEAPNYVQHFDNVIEMSRHWKPR